jgi:hypothetical protein
MNILQSVRNFSNIKMMGAIVLTGILGALVGAVTMNEYNYQVDRPKFAAYGHYETMMDLTTQVGDVFDKNDKRYDLAHEFLAKKGSHISYFYRIGDARAAAVKASKLSSRHYDEASIDALDTRAADSLLLEAIDYLNDGDLYWILMGNTSKFDQSSRADIRSRLEKNDYTYPIERYTDLLSLQSSLSELERSKLQGCYKKLEAFKEDFRKDEAMIKAGMCSEKTAYKPYVLWGGDSESMFDRFMRAIGHPRGYQ